MRNSVFVIVISILLSFQDKRTYSGEEDTTPKVLVANCYVVPFDNLKDPIFLMAVNTDTIAVKNGIKMRFNPDSAFSTSPPVNDFLVPDSLAANRSEFKYFTPISGRSNKELAFIGGHAALSRVKTMCVAAEGDLWFGTNGGASKISYAHGDSSLTIEYFTTNEGLCNNVVSAITKDELGNIWIGTGHGKLSYYNGQTFVNFNKSGDAILCMTVDHEGNLWIGRYNGVSRYDPRTQLFSIFTTAQGLSHNTVQCVMEDRMGRMWFGTFSGVTCYDPRKPKGENFVHYREAHGLPNDDINSIAEDSIGNIWFGTSGGGAICFDGKFFTLYSIAQGLISNTVHTIFQDTKNNLWFATSGGLSQLIRPSTVGLKHGTPQPYKSDAHIFVNHKYGTAGESFRNSVCQDPDGNIWWGTTTGVIIYTQ